MDWRENNTMTKRREVDDRWEHMLRQLRRLAGTGPLSLIDAQRLLDAAPDVPLSPAAIQSIVSDALARAPHRRDLADDVWPGRPFTCDVVLLAEGVVGHSAEVVVLDGGDILADPQWMTDFNSLSVDTRRITGLKMASSFAGRGAAVEPETVDVVPRCDQWDRSVAGRILQATLRWDACLDGTGLDGRQVGIVDEFGCGWGLYDRELVEAFYGN
jgi:hypothetical protein